MSEFETKVFEQFDLINSRFNSFEEKIEFRLDRIEDRLNIIENKVDVIEHKIDRIDTRLLILERDLNYSGNRDILNKLGDKKVLATND